MLVVITFVSLPVCQIHDSFHHVELVQSRLSPFGTRGVSRHLRSALVHVLRAAAVASSRGSSFTSYRFGDQAPTYLATPLWIPQAVMVLGTAAMCFAMVRTLAGERRARARVLEALEHGRDGGLEVSPDVQIVVTFAFFLVLLASGMAVPFAIAVPAMALSADAGRPAGPQQPRPRELGAA